MLLLANMALSAALPTEFVVTPRFEVFYALYYSHQQRADFARSMEGKSASETSRRFPNAVANRVAPVPLSWPLLADRRPAHAWRSDVRGEFFPVVREMPAPELKANILSGIFHDAAPCSHS